MVEREEGYERENSLSGTMDVLSTPDSAFLRLRFFLNPGKDKISPARTVAFVLGDSCDLSVA
jgi:hypothetical protein